MIQLFKWTEEDTKRALKYSKRTLDSVEQYLAKSEEEQKK